ncbi:hypothetical protein PG996_006537 [Apiospora saccharicola]|uniref:C2H2-type domain-containing protein n=1 Tax=Apiospora saccharicola TaxID=335842 RepID=A0ABR1V897_9PEZI
MKALEPELCEAYEQGRQAWDIFERSSFNMPELEHPYVFTGGNEADENRFWAIPGDWPFDFETPMTAIPPLSEASWSPESHYASPSNESLTDISEGSYIGQYTYSNVNKKRSRGDSTVYDSDSDGESPNGSKRAKHSPGGNETKGEPSTTYACPFLKKHPHKHRDCAKYVFKRVRDVKQHLNRSHRTPDFYCARCYDVFPNSKERDEHTRDKQCQVQPNRRFEGITEEQKGLLLQNKGRNKSNEEQWFLMWDILFPNTRRPGSVYRCNPQEEAVVMLRDVWNTRQRDFLADIRPAMAVAHNTIHDLMGKIFDRLEWESRVPSQPARKSSKAATTAPVPTRILAAVPDYIKMATGDDAIPWADILDETTVQQPSPPYEEL